MAKTLSIESALQLAQRNVEIAAPIALATENPALSFAVRAKAANVVSANLDLIVKLTAKISTK